MLFVGLLASIKAVSHTATTLREDKALTAPVRTTGFADRSVLADMLDTVRDADWVWFHVSGGSS